MEVLEIPCPECGGRLHYNKPRKRTRRKLVCENPGCNYSRYVSPKPGMQEEFKMAGILSRLLRRK